LAIYAREADAFDEQEAELLEELAEQLSYGIHALRTYEKHTASVIALQKEKESQEALGQILNISLQNIPLDDNLQYP